MFKLFQRKKSGPIPRAAGTAQPRPLSDIRDLQDKPLPRLPPQRTPSAPESSRKKQGSLPYGDTLAPPAAPAQVPTEVYSNKSFNLSDSHLTASPQQTVRTLGEGRGHKSTTDLAGPPDESSENPHSERQLTVAGEAESQFSPFSPDLLKAAAAQNQSKKKEQAPLPQDEALLQSGIKFHEDGELEKATNCFKEAAALGNPNGMFLFGISLRHGWVESPSSSSSSRLIMRE